MTNSNTLYKEAVSAACKVLGIPPAQEHEWYVSCYDLWRQREDGLYEWCGVTCPPEPNDRSMKYVRDEARKS